VRYIANILHTYYCAQGSLSEVRERCHFCLSSTLVTFPGECQVRTVEKCTWVQGYLGHPSAYISYWRSYLVRCHDLDRPHAITD